MTTVTAQQAHDHRKNGTPCLLVDVRTPMEHREVHAEGVHLLPLDTLSAERLSALRAGPEQPVYLLCRSGGRATKAHEALAKAGVDNCFVVMGGTEAWVQAGLPVVRGKKGMSLERQVRIAAGFLALTGAVLSVTVHPYAIALSGFVGAGLMFAGFTDWCGMGLLLAKMPWNKVEGAAGATCSKA